MDGLVVSEVLAGVIAALVGAAAAYYFGMRQQRQKQVHERQREERNRQEELKRRRSTAINEIRAGVLTVVDLVRSWAGKVGRLSEQVTMLPAEREALMGYQEKVIDVLKQRSNIEAEMSSLRVHYEKEAPQLEPSTRSLFNSFVNEFEQRYTPLAEYFMLRAVKEQGAMLHEEGQEHLEGPYYSGNIVPDFIDDPVLRRLGNQLGDISLGMLRIYLDKKRSQNILEETLQNFQKDFNDPALAQAVKYAQDWDRKAYQDAFDKEAQRAASTSLR